MNPVRPVPSLRPLHRLPTATHAALPAALALLGAIPLAQAQTTPAAEPPAAVSRSEAFPLGQALAQVEETVRWVGRELGQERIVKGAPYCADAVHESIQPLADGNRIVERQTTRLCRDGEGRTRQEVTTRDGRQTVYLRDPVSGESWVLDPARKTARRGGALGPAPNGQALAEAAAAAAERQSALQIDAAAAREHAQAMREWARQVAERARAAAGTGQTAPVPPTPPMPPMPPTGARAPAAPTPEPVVITRTETAEGHGRSREVEVQVLRVAPDAQGLPPWPALMAPPAVGARAVRLAPRGPGVVTALPARDIEGVRANGERTTWTIEAGRIGNERPIVITREVWTSPDLMLTLSSRDADPRSGEVNYRLQNLRRGEPDATLMQVPADYDAPRRQTRPPTPSPGARG